MANNEMNLHNENHTQGTMKNKLSTIYGISQDMEKRVEDLESNNACLQNKTDDILDQIKREKNQQSELLTNLNSLKGVVESLKNLQQNVKDKGEITQETSAQCRDMLLKQHNEQVHNQKCHEENMHQLAQTFVEAPQLYNPAGLMDSILELKREIKNRDEELSEFRKELVQFESEFSKYKSSNSDFQTALDVFQSSYGDVTTETMKLSTDLDKLNVSLQNLRQELVMLKSRHA